MNPGGASPTDPGNTSPVDPGVASSTDAGGTPAAQQDDNVVQRDDADSDNDLRHRTDPQTDVVSRDTEDITSRGDADTSGAADGERSSGRDDAAEESTPGDDNGDGHSGAGGEDRVVEVREDSEADEDEEGRCSAALSTDKGKEGGATRYEGRSSHSLVRGAEEIAHDLPRRL